VTILYQARERVARARPSLVSYVRLGKTRERLLLVCASFLGVIRFDACEGSSLQQRWPRLFSAIVEFSSKFSQRRGFGDHMLLCVGSSKGIVLLDPERARVPLMVHADPAPVWCLAADCFDRNLIYAGSNECVALGNARTMRTLSRSRDGGKSWEDITPRGSVDEDVWAIAASPSEPGWLLVGTSRGRLLRSYDAGQTFEECLGLRDVRSRLRWEPGCAGSAPRVRAIVFDPSQPEVFYVAVEGGGVFRSREGSDSFEPLNNGLNLDVHSIAVSPYDSNVLYAATGAGFYRSTNGGRLWSPVLLECVRSYAVPTLATNQPVGAVFTAAGFGPPQTWIREGGARARLFRSVDGAQSFQAVTVELEEDPLHGMVMTIVQNPARPDEFFATTSRGMVLRSQDGGETFTSLTANLPPAYSALVLA